MYKFFISPDGKVRADNPANKNMERFDLEKFGIRNIFDTRDSAHLMREVLEERYPRIFYEERRKNKRS